MIRSGVTARNRTAGTTSSQARSATRTGRGLLRARFHKSDIARFYSPDWSATRAGGPPNHIKGSCLPTTRAGAPPKLLLAWVGIFVTDWLSAALYPSSMPWGLKRYQQARDLHFVRSPHFRRWEGTPPPKQRRLGWGTLTMVRLGHPPLPFRDRATLCHNATGSFPMVASFFVDCAGRILLLDHTSNRDWVTRRFKHHSATRRNHAEQMARLDLGSGAVPLRGHATEGGSASDIHTRRARPMG